MRFLPRYVTIGIEPRIVLKAANSIYIIIHGSAHLFKLLALEISQPPSLRAPDCATDRLRVILRTIMYGVWFPSILDFYPGTCAHLFYFFPPSLGTLKPGCNFIGCDLCMACYNTRAVSMRINEQVTRCDTKTKDNVFVRTYHS